MIGSELRVTSLQGEIQEFFIGGGGGEVPILVQKGLLNFFVANYFSPTPHPTSHWEGRDDYVFLNLWKPVATGAGNTALRAEANGSLEGNQLQSHFLISLEFSLVENYNTRFIKKIQQLNSDMQSYRSKDFSLKQVSGLMGGPDPPDPPPGSATALVPFDILSTAFGINSNTPIAR